jgi:hypothetical protein
VFPLVTVPALADVDVCDGDPQDITFGPVTPTGQAPFVFQWLKDGVAIPGATTDQFTVLGPLQTADAGVYTVEVTDDNACNTATASATVTVGTLPSVTLMSQTVCAGDTVVFTAVTGGTGPFTFTWFKDGTLLVGETGDTLTLTNVQPADGGDYKVDVVTACGPANAQAALTVEATTEASPLTDVNAPLGTPLVTIGPTVATGTAPITYSWTKDGVPIPGALGPELTVGPITAGAAGEYCVTVAGACGTVEQCATLSVGAPIANGAGGRHPGSVLIFPVHRTGANFFTIVSVTNTNTSLQGPTTAGGSTLAHYQYANVDVTHGNPFRPQGCNLFERSELLTPADTLSVLTGCHDAVNPNGQPGYLVVSARDPSKESTPWAHDHLIGSELVVNASGGVYGINAIPFRALPNAGEETDIDLDGLLDFDDVEYERMPDRLFVPSFLGLAGSQLTLTNFTGGPLAVNSVQITGWNDNEFPFSATLDFNCWFDQPLANVSPLFTASFLAGLPNDPDEVDMNCVGVGSMESGWFVLDSVGVFTPGGEQLSDDGAMLGAITAGQQTTINGGTLLWESKESQDGGAAISP